MEDETMQTTAITEPTSEETPAVTPEDDAAPDMSEEVATETAEEVPADAGEEVTASAPAAEELIFTPVYKGAVTPIKASDTEEVTTLLQLGMRQRAFLPVYEQLEQLAHESGAKTVDEFVKNAFEHNEEKHLNDAITRFGKEEGEKFYQYQKAERSKAFSRYQQQSADAEKKAVENRNAVLADQFVEMQAEYPEYAEFKDVPKAVVELALSKGIHLMDAVARFKRSEEKKIAQAAAEAKKGAEAAAGSMTDTDDSVGDPLWKAFESGADR